MARSPLEQLATTLDDLGRVIDGIGDDQWPLPTPCPDWTVADLVRHVVAGNALFAAVLTDHAPTAADDPAQRDDGELPVAYRASADALLAAFAADGAMQRMVTVPVGTVPGAVAVHLRTVEALVHGWDLAQATGQRPGFDEAITEQELAFTRAKLADVPAGRTPFAPPQPVSDDAPALDRLAACLGRAVAGTRQ